MPEPRPDSCPPDLARWCAARRWRHLRPLAGGSLSQVHLVTDADGRQVVVKWDPDAPDALAAEAAWLRRHPHAPTPLAVSGAALALEFVDAEHLVEHSHTAGCLDRLGPFDLARERHWLGLCDDASGPPHRGDLDLADRTLASTRIALSRHGLPDPTVDQVEGFLAWVADRPTDGWCSVALDAIPKNVLVDATGSWWAIDPMCTTAPRAVLWCPWAVFRTVFCQPDLSTSARIDQQVQLLDTAVDRDVAARWMPAFVLWQLRWTPPWSPAVEVLATMLAHWLDVWASTPGHPPAPR